MSKAFDISTMTGEELRFLIKPITTYNNVLIDQNELNRRVLLSQPQEQGMMPSNKSSLCSLPLEVVHTIFEKMDMQAIFRLRATSTSNHALVEAWRPFQVIMRNAPSAVQALIATNASRLWTTTDLQKRIFTTQCEICNNHGEILHLLKMQRVCFNCVTTSRQLLAISPDYAMYTMGLSESEILTLPFLRTNPQKSFWGWPKGTDFAVDYTAALNMAMTNHENNNQKPRLPSYLLNPPESDYLQHAACIHFPAQQNTRVGTKIAKAALCAGCVYYWNYHSTLPYQCHTLHPHEHILRMNTLKPNYTPLMKHISTCVFAKAYWSKLYLPELNHLRTTNPHLAVNGGHLSAKQMMQEQQVRLVSLFSQKQERFRHFYRHPETRDGRVDHSGQDNNARFDEVPIQLLHAAAPMATIENRTALDLELEAKEEAGDPQICAALSEQNDSQLSNWERSQISRIRMEEDTLIENGEDTSPDVFADILFGGGASVSQSSWATARTTGPNNLFKNWSQLLEDRKWKEAEAMARDTNEKVDQMYSTITGWGMDRFGCVSSLV